MATEILRPNAAGDETAISNVSGSATHWEAVDDVSPDGTSTCIYTTSSVSQRDLYNIPNHSVGSGVINSIRVVGIFVADVEPSQSSVYLSIKTGSTVYSSTAKTITTSWLYKDNYWYTNPATGNPWTWDEIDSLQIGVSMREPKSGSYYSYCTQLYVVVDYTAPEAIQLSCSDGLKAGESILTGGTIGIIVTDGFKSGDLAKGARVYSNIALDGLKLSDSDIQNLTRSLVCSDGLTLSEVLLPIIQADLEASDGVSMGDEPSTNINVILILTDGIKLGNQTSSSDIFELLSTDGLVAGESMIDNTSVNSVIVDIVKVGDLSSSGLSFFDTILDGMKLGDTPSAGSAFYLTATDGIELSETLIIILNLRMFVTDGIKLSETLATLLESFPSLSDGAIINEFISSWGGVSKARLTVGTMNRTRIQVTLQGGGT